ncbi:RloB family protein [Myxococcota bacterium]|nr:RloB family protein [Myxococcota bacterium]MBU1511816.1 RloB family protein [Myxococcota bacterium]
MKRPSKETQKNPWAQSRATGRRRQDFRRQCRRFLIVCEGEKTEPNYFKSLAALLDWDKIDVEIDPAGMNTRSLVDRAIPRKMDRNDVGEPLFDEIWVVFDKDSFKPDQFDNAIHKAEAAGLKVAWSNEAFELWYVLHFQYRNTGMPREDYQRVLTGYLKQPYKKNDSEMYDKHGQLGNQPRAIRFAKRLEMARTDASCQPSAAHPCTLVYKLVETLLKHR